MAREINRLTPAKVMELMAQRLPHSRFVKVPVAGMLSTDYAKERSGLIDLDQANCSFQPGTPRGADPTLSACLACHPFGPATHVDGTVDLLP